MMLVFIVTPVPKTKIMPILRYSINNYAIIDKLGRFVENFFPSGPGAIAALSSHFPLLTLGSEVGVGSTKRHLTLFPAPGPSGIRCF
jgi:hypothetical protein